MWHEIILQALWLILPAYIANASAVIVGGGTPVDFGKTLKDGRRLFGDGKTWRGLFVGTFIGMTVGFALVVIASFLANSRFQYLGLATFEGFPLMLPLIFSLCFGSLLGDIVESFFKRRLGKQRGENWFGFDQLDFLVGALILSFCTASLLQLFSFTQGNWFVQHFSLWHIVVLFVITPLFHLFANMAHRKNKRRNQCVMKQKDY